MKDPLEYREMHMVFTVCCIFISHIMREKKIFHGCVFIALGSIFRSEAFLVHHDRSQENFEDQLLLIGPEMEKVSWPYFDPEFNTLPERIYGPILSVNIDNESVDDCTVIKVDSANRQDLLLEVVQVLTELNLSIRKSYISFDAGWFMDVFHVKDENGHKLADLRSINHVQQAIGAARGNMESPRAKSHISKFQTPEHTAIEMKAADRPGLFSEISAALTDLHCNIVEAHAWSHNARLACVAYISDQFSDSPIDDPLRLATIEDHLTTVLRATTTRVDVEQQEAKTADLIGGEGMMTNVERRLHQLMLSVKDYDLSPCKSSTGLRPLRDFVDNEEGKKTVVSVEGCYEKGYSIVNVECKDRPRLMFDTVCTLVDMQYMIFHASVRSCEGSAFQEYFIRQVDGCPLNTDGEKDRVIKCLEAAIERRVSEVMS
ncbi:ACT domain-containing protein, partial [Drosera capensis]